MKMKKISVKILALTLLLSAIAQPSIAFAQSSEEAVLPNTQVGFYNTVPVSVTELNTMQLRA